MTTQYRSLPAKQNPNAGNAVLLKASWNGNNQFAGSASSPASLTVTGLVTRTPTLLLSIPSTASQGQTVTLSLTVINPTSSLLNANVTLQITGPGNYVSFDVIQVRVAASSQFTTYYDWRAPNQAGTYTVTAGLRAKQGGIDTGTVRPSTATIEVTTNQKSHMMCMCGDATCPFPSRKETLKERLAWNLH